MITNCRRSRAVLSAARVPFRLVYRAVLLVVTMLVLGFCYACGGVPRIECPEKKNRLTDVNRN